MSTSITYEYATVIIVFIVPILYLSMYNVVFQLTHTYTHIQDINNIAGPLVSCTPWDRESSVFRPLLYLQATMVGYISIVWLIKVYLHFVQSWEKVEIKTEQSLPWDYERVFQIKHTYESQIVIGNTDLTKYRCKKYLIDKLFRLSVSGTQMITIYF